MCHNSSAVLMQAAAVHKTIDADIARHLAATSWEKAQVLAHFRQFSHCLYMSMTCSILISSIAPGLSPCISLAVQTRARYHEWSPWGADLHAPSRLQEQAADAGASSNKPVPTYSCLTPVSHLRQAQMFCGLQASQDRQPACLPPAAGAAVASGVRVIAGPSRVRRPPRLPPAAGAVTSSGLRLAETGAGPCTAAGRRQTQPRKQSSVAAPGG